MTFIIAIQLKDSIIVAIDNKFVKLKRGKYFNFQEFNGSKLYAWSKGIITGTGEHYVIDKAVRLFVNNADSDIKKLPICLNISRQIREMEVGQHEQILMTKLLYSSFTVNGPKLFAVEHTEESGKYITTNFKEKDLILWLHNPDIHQISDNLKALYTHLRPCSSFTCVKDWIGYYSSAIADIYTKHSSIDISMSCSFDIFFQTKDHCYYRHIANGYSIEN
ncbi:hypothetical protein [Acinetobacter sp. ESBL14]|uniref:hypothetical protein n=1 Tax=Acinetobacter sp. ESBL14 TaxID=3077329 RepID=UPI002FC6ADBB